MFLILDIARGLAALGVFFFHIRESLSRSMPHVAWLAEYGDLGVPLFFVVSGYAITASARSTLTKRLSPHEFLKRRILRIFPPFWASIVVVLAVPFVIEAISALKTGQFHPPAQAFRTMSGGDWVKLLTLTAVFDASNADLEAQFTRVNAVYWTLAIEVQFYVCMYLALLFRSAFAYALIAVTILSAWVYTWPTGWNHGLFLHYWLMFALGIALYHLRARRWTLDGWWPTTALPLAVATTVAIGALVLALAARGVLDQVFARATGSTELTFALATMLVLWAATPFESTVQKQLHVSDRIRRMLVRTGATLGAMSYSVYLIHGKVYELPMMFVRQVVPDRWPLAPLLAVTVTLMICYVFHLVAERPFMSGALRSHLRLKTTDEGGKSVGGR